MFFHAENKITLTDWKFLIQFYPFRRQSHKMVKHTQTIRQ